MGNCITCCTHDIIHLVAIKFPHGITGMVADASSTHPAFKPIQDMNQWIHSLYDTTTFPYQQWAIYNDQAPNHITKKGHCKGIIVWNEQTISWLCHSVPHFPAIFSETYISDIDSNECLYGQSFHYLAIPYTEQILSSIFTQLTIMQANIYSSKINRPMPSETRLFHKLVLTPTITHIAKSPNYHVDIYQELAITKGEQKVWYVESWIRGKRAEDTRNVISIHEIQVTDPSAHYLESQDHSKWAVTDNEFFMGDLNRMTSQYHRGGGGFHCIHAEMANLLKKIIVH